jgi:two-component system KDP operon response regulator KdpE
VAKPFSMAELMARIQAVLRRYNHSLESNHVQAIDDRLSVDRARGQILVDGQAVDLSDIEYKLLTCLLDQPGSVLTHQTLLTQVWGWEYGDESGYLKVYVHRLRTKIEPDPQNPRYILTERGRGYCFQIPSYEGV